MKELSYYLNRKYQKRQGKAVASQAWKALEENGSGIRWSDPISS